MWPEKNSWVKNSGTEKKVCELARCWRASPGSDNTLHWAQSQPEDGGVPQEGPCSPEGLLGTGRMGAGPGTGWRARLSLAG